MEVIEHYDAGKFGHPRIDASTEGVRILDLIRSKEIGPDALPLSPAAESVLDALEALGDQLPLYETTATSWARPIPLTRPVSLIVEQRRETYDEAAIRQRRRQVITGSSWGGDWRDVNPRSLGIVRRAETRQVPWLETLRKKLIGANNRKGLEHPDLVRLVIPRQVANDLFRVPSFWEGQPEPIKLQGPGMYPPPELQGIRPHDADRWGEQLTDDATPRAVARVADLVRFVADQLGMRAVRPVAARVLDAMTEGAPTLYLLNQGDLAAAVEPGHVWRRRFPSGAEHRQIWARLEADSAAYGVIACAGLTTDLEEAEARGVKIEEQDRAMGAVYCEEEWPELPALVGAAGALEWARLQWVERARTFADLDAGDLGRLAVPLAWAVSVFGKPVQDMQQQAAEPPVATSAAPAPTLAPVAAIVPTAQRTAVARDARIQGARDEGFKRAKEPAEEWTAQHRAELLRQFEFLTASGPGKLKAEAAQGWLSELWGLEVNSIRVYLGKARKDRPGKSKRHG